MRGVRRLLPHCCMQPGPEVIRPLPGQASRPVLLDTANRPVHLLLFKYCIINWEGCQRHRHAPPRRRESPVELDPLCGHLLNGNSCWGRGGGRSLTSRYHPCIQIHASFNRGGSNAKRASTLIPDTPSRSLRSFCGIACTFLHIYWIRR